jgi:UPF0755 protein
MGATSTRTKVFFKILKSVLQLFLNILFYVLVVLAIMKLSTAAFEFSYQVFGNVVVEEAPGTDVEIKIQEGESTSSIARKLAVQKLVVNQYSFYLRTKLTTGSDKPILPGSYTLNTSMNYDDILAIITDMDAGKLKEDTEAAE